ncbi:MAG: flavin oxidoreductase/NADH oxidase [Promethearchaeota archaeon]|nr:MAG: flavin oxidoreductase/NADH oxidase [Candidatus Lokiarchaeota archaeon]
MVKKVRKSKDSSFKPFHYKSLSQLEREIEKLHLNIPISKDISILKKKKRFKNIFIPNRLAIQPMEGFDAKQDGSPSILTNKRYQRYANSGVALIWFEATAFVREGRSNPHQLMITEKNLEDFRKLVQKTRNLCNRTLQELGFNNKCLLILQINHSGRYSKKEEEAHPIKAFNYKPLEIKKEKSKIKGKIISDEELQEIENQWIDSIFLAKEAGFDGADIKSCHGYLINELLSAHRREGSKYGGPKLRDRAKLLLNIISKSVERMDDKSDFFLTTRISVYNGIPFPYGFGVEKSSGEEFPAPVNLDEPKKLISLLYKKGIRLINISAGNPHHKPYITRPYDTPVKGGEKPAEHPLISLNRIYTLTEEIKSSQPDDMIIIGSALSYLRQYSGYIAAGLINKKIVDICGFGRMAFANPQFPKQLFTEGVINKKKTCISCSKCSELMKEGKETGCVIRNPLYKQNNS